MRIHRSYFILLLLFSCLLTLPSDAFCRDGDPDARGRIDQVTNTLYEIVVEGKTSNGPLWLGCTVIHKSGREQDLEAKHSGKCLIFCSGDFREKFKMPASLTSGEISLDYVVALWRWKVEQSECHKGRNGGPCEWCRRNGYHLEDRVDIGRGTWTLSLEKETTDRNDLREGQRDAERSESRKQSEYEQRQTSSKTKTTTERNQSISRSRPTSFSDITVEDIMSASLSSRNINGSDNSSNRIPRGTILVYRTSEGRYGKLQIRKYDYNLTIRWTTYDRNGRVHSTGSNLVIRGTWSCDLDEGIESNTSADFWWQQETSRERYLTPKNGAKFVVW